MERIKDKGTDELRYEQKIRKLDRQRGKIEKKTKRETKDKEEDSKKIKEKKEKKNKEEENREQHQGKWAWKSSAQGCLGKPIIISL